MATERNDNLFRELNRQIADLDARILALKTVGVYPQHLIGEFTELYNRRNALMLPLVSA